jgi:hypothetical protein
MERTKEQMIAAICGAEDVSGRLDVSGHQGMAIIW